MIGICDNDNDDNNGNAPIYAATFAGGHVFEKSPFTIFALIAANATIYSIQYK